MSGPEWEGVRIEGDAVELTGTDAINKMIVAAPMVGEEYRIPLLRAARDNRLSFCLAVDGRTVPSRFLKMGRPLAVLLADDVPGAVGPSHWPQARKLLRWAQYIILHAAAGLPEHYEAVSLATVKHRRVLVIEMEYRQYGAWLHLVRHHVPRVQMLSVLPQPGTTHPVSPVQAGETVH